MLVVIKKDSGEYFSALSHVKELTDLQERKRYKQDIRKNKHQTNEDIQKS